MLRAQMSGLAPAKSEILYSAQAGPEGLWSGMTIVFAS